MTTQDALDRIQMELEGLGLTYSDRVPRASFSRNVHLQAYTRNDTTDSIVGAVRHNLSAEYVIRSNRPPATAFEMPPVYEDDIQFMVSAVSFDSQAGQYEETVTIVAVYV